MGRVSGTPQLRRSRKNPRNGPYYIYWTDAIEGSKELSTRKTDYPSAKAFYDRWWKQNLGIQSARPAEDVLLNELLDDYLQDRRNVAAAPERLQYASRALLTYWGGKPASVVNRYTCAEYVDFRLRQHEKRFPTREPLSINTIRRELGVLRTALNMAFKDRTIDSQIFVFLPSEIRSDIEYFKCDEAIGLLRAARSVGRAKDHIRLFLWIGFLTGRRKQAILGLKWRHIDFDADIIRWDADVRSETNKKRPVARLPRRLKKTLLRHRAHHPDDEYVITYQAGSVSDIKTAFKATVNFYRLQQAKTQEKFNGAARDPETILPVAYPHMMRHSCATWLMQKGNDRRETCEFLGMSEETLIRRYYHHHPDFQKGAADAF